MPKWGYGDDAHGPANWSKTWSIADGNQQSPVDISGGAQSAMPPLAFKYVAEDQVKISNVGWNMIGNLSKPSELSGGPLSSPHRLASFHFHWGPSDSAGSEHTIDGHQYPAELHICHFNSDKYSSFAEASDKDDGLGIVAVMCNVGAEHEGVKKIINSVGQIVKTGDSAVVSGAFDPNTLLPNDTSSFWCYHGSLTTPPCPESVEWIVLKNQISVSSVQLASLRKLQDADGNPIVRNFRPCCPLKGRVIKKC